MSGDILAQILARPTAVEGEGRLLAEISANTEQLLTSLDAIRENLTVLGGGNDHTQLLDDIERRLPR